MYRYFTKADNFVNPQANASEETASSQDSSSSETKGAPSSPRTEPSRGREKMSEPKDCLNQDHRISRILSSIRSM